MKRKRDSRGPVRLTRSGLSLVGLTVFALVMSPTSNPTIFIVMAVFLAILLVNVPFAAFGVRGLTVRRDHPTHVREGSRITVRLHLLNQSRWAKALLQFIDAGPCGTSSQALPVPMLGGNEGGETSYSCVAGRRGVYALKTCRVESTAPFGLVKVGRDLSARSELVVYPIYYELTGTAPPFHKSFSGVTAAPGARPGEGISFFGLREYRPGDPIRRIHWPSTLRARTVMVKEFEEDLHSSVSILLDTCAASVDSRGGNDNLEVAIRVAASLANCMLVSGHPTSLVYADAATDALCVQRAAEELTPILDGLARVAPSGWRSTRMLDTCATSASKSSNWMVVMLSSDDDAFERVLRIRSKGIELTVIVVENRNARRARDASGGMSTMLEAAGVNLISIAPDDDVQAALSKNLRPSRRVMWR